MTIPTPIIQETDSKGIYYETGLPQSFIDIPVGPLPLYVPGPYITPADIQNYVIVWQDLKCTNSSNPNISTGIRLNIEDLNPTEPLPYSWDLIISSVGDRTFGKPWVRIEGPTKVSPAPNVKWVNSTSTILGEGPLEQMPAGYEAYNLVEPVSFNLEFELTGKFYREYYDVSLAGIFLYNESLGDDWLYKAYFDQAVGPITINNVVIDRTFVPDEVKVRFSIEVQIDHSKTRDLVLNGMKRI